MSQQAESLRRKLAGLPSRAQMERGELPEHTRPAIAGAVHQAVCEVTGTDGAKHCAAYAMAGHLIANVIAGRRDAYVFQAGRVHVFTGNVDEDGAELALEMDPAKTGYSDLEFHDWFTRVPAGVPRSGTWTSISGAESESVELVDLSLRHFPQLVAEAGLPWNRLDLPPFLWGRPAAFQAIGVYLAADAQIMRLLIPGVLERDSALVKQITRRALIRLGLSVDDRAWLMTHRERRSRDERPLDRDDWEQFSFAELLDLYQEKVDLNDWKDEEDEP
jgi:hypothetical protein